MPNISVLAILYRDGTPEKNCGKCAFFRKTFKKLENICTMWNEEKTEPEKWCSYGIVEKGNW